MSSISGLESWFKQHCPGHIAGRSFLGRAGQSKNRLIVAGTIPVVFLQVGCGPSALELANVDHAPLTGDDWPISTLEEEGLDPTLVAEMYLEAAELETNTVWGLSGTVD